MLPWRARRTSNALNDIEGNYSLELSHNNIKAPIPEITVAMVIEYIKELQANQDKMAAMVKQL